MEAEQRWSSRPRYNAPRVGLRGIGLTGKTREREES